METPVTERDKRSASSPLDNAEKKPRDESTSRQTCGSAVACGLNLDQATISAIVNAVSSEVSARVAAEVTAEMRKEISVLRGEVVRLRSEVQKRDREIESLQERLDESEQYSRRNAIRIHGIPESAHENTDNVIVNMAEQIGADIFHDCIDRSHRVGRKGDYTRPIICKFTSHKHKLAIMTKKRNLRNTDTKKNFNTDNVFISEDLTKLRADVARNARHLKKDKKITDTWTRDGVIFVKTLGGQIERIKTQRELDRLFRR